MTMLRDMSNAEFLRGMVAIGLIVPTQEMSPEELLKAADEYEPLRLEMAANEEKEAHHMQAAANKRERKAAKRQRDAERSGR